MSNILRILHKVAFFVIEWCAAIAILSDILALLFCTLLHHLIFDELSNTIYTTNTRCQPQQKFGYFYTDWCNSQLSYFILQHQTTFSLQSRIFHMLMPNNVISSVFRDHRVPVTQTDRCTTSNEVSRYVLNYYLVQGMFVRIQCCYLVGSLTIHPPIHPFLHLSVCLSDHVTTKKFLGIADHSSIHDPSAQLSSVCQGSSQQMIM